jgi:hypothetical protein
MMRAAALPEARAKAWSRRDLMTDPHHPYSVAILSSPTEIRRLDDFVRRLMPNRDVAIQPEFFLATVSEKWRPRVVVVSRDETILGVVYTKELKIAGVPTGLLYTDGRLNNLVVADAADQEEIIRVAIQSLFALPRVRGLRFAIPPAGLEARAVASSQSLVPFDIGYVSTEAHTRLVLPGHYEEFLQSLGYKTRRNFRYYRRKFESAGHTYVENVSLLDVRRAAADLYKKSRIRKRPSEVDWDLNVVAASNRAWVVGLKHRNGEWLSLAAGWHSSGRATMLFQLNNDLEYGDASLSVVLRAYLIEALIRAGTPELVFWSGSAPPLSRYVIGIPAIRVHLDAPTPGWRLMRSAFGMALPRISKWIGKDLSLIACSESSCEPPHLTRHLKVRASQDVSD